eukprot:EG_transcript_2117
MLLATAVHDMVTPTEAFDLWAKGDFAILDIRSDMEGREGHIRGPDKGTIDIPLFTAKARYDATLGRRVVEQEANRQWLDQVRSLFPRDAKLIIMCSDGRNRTHQALDLLAAEGFTNVRGLEGGYNKWDQLYDKRLQPRGRSAQASRAEFLVDPVEWQPWAPTVGRAAPARLPKVAAAPSWEPAPTPSPGFQSAGKAYLDPAFQAATIAAFPRKRVATVEEARDIRSEMEGSEGRIRGPNKGSIDFPLFNAKARYDAALGQRVVDQEANEAWLEQVRGRFAKDAKIIVVCSDGNRRTAQAMELLRREGFQNVVALAGGYNAWDQLFDKDLLLRTPQQQRAKAEWLVDPVPWGQWTGACGTSAPPPRTDAPRAAALTSPLPLPAKGPSYTIPAFQEQTIRAFPAKRVASVEESRMLWKLDGYSILDIRSEMEGSEGRIRGPNKGSIDFPLFNARARYDARLGQKVVDQEPNGQWLEQVQARFPRDAKLIVMCSDGRQRTAQAVALLEAAGYRNVVAMAGGYKAWDQLFDRALALRSPQQQQAKAAALTDPVQWGQWRGGHGGAAAPAAGRAVPAAAPAGPPAGSAAPKQEAPRPAAPTGDVPKPLADGDVSRREALVEGGLNPAYGLLAAAVPAVFVADYIIKEMELPNPTKLATKIADKAATPGTKVVAPVGDVLQLPPKAEVVKVAEAPAPVPTVVLGVEPVPNPRAWMEANLPEALPAKRFVRLTSQILRKKGMVPGNTVPCVSVCRDELCQPLVDEIEEEWGDAFSMTSLAGMLRLGKKGLSAAIAHSPQDENGKERYFFVAMPHISVDTAGVGQCIRVGRSKLSKACGALYALKNELEAGKVTVAADPLDPEYSYMKAAILDLLPKDAKPSLLELTKVSAEASLRQLEELVAATVDPSKADYAVFVGVLVHEQDIRPANAKVVNK